MGTEAQAQIRELLVKMLETVDSSPDSLSEHYAALRDGSYQLATQVRTAAIVDPWARRDAFIQEALPNFKGKW